MLRTMRTLHTALLAVLTLVGLGAGHVLAQSTSVSMVDVAGMPGDTVWVPVKVTSSDGLSGVQVSVSVTDAAIAEVSGFDTNNTVAGDIKAAGGFEQVGTTSYVVANASAVAVTKADLIVIGFALKAEGSTTATVDVTLAVGDNPPVSKQYTLTPNVIVSNTVVQAPSGTVKVGVASDLGVTITGVGAAIYGYQFELVYDPTVLDITADITGTLSDVTGAVFQANEIAAGRLRVVWAATSGISTDGTLLNLMVEGVAEGSSTLTFENVLFSDANGNGIAVAPQAGEVMAEINQAPTFTNAIMDTLMLYQGETFNYDFDATDPNGDPITFFLPDPAPTVSIDPATGVLIVSVPMDMDPGLYEGQVGVTDGIDTTLATIILEVLAPESIATVRGTSDGTFLTTEGVVTRAMGRFVYIQDGDVAITLFQSSGDFRDAVESGAIKKGDRLRVYGEVATFNELKEIYPENFYVVSENNPLPEPQQVTVAELASNGEAYEAELVLVYGFDLDTRGDSVFSASTNYPIKDASVTDFGLVDLRIPSASDTEWEGQPIPQPPLAFTGVVGQYRTKYQLLAIELSDIRSVVANETDELPAEFSVSGLYPNPFVNELNVQVDVPASMEVEVTLYDMLGREVRVLKPGVVAAGSGRELKLSVQDLPAGVYFLRVRGEDATGKTYQEVRRVVHIK